MQFEEINVFKIRRNASTIYLLTGFILQKKLYYILVSGKAGDVSGSYKPLFGSGSVLQGDSSSLSDDDSL